MDIAATLARIVAARKTQAGALLPILHDIQDALGHVPDEAVALIAAELNLSRAEVHGVLTYYHHFRQVPSGRHVVRVCRAEACQAVGGEALAAHAAARLAGGDLTLEPVFCLGLCASGPALQIDETTLHAQVTPEKFDALIDALGDAAGARP
jgi:formate dehydrogenase subunit gamma